MRRTDRGFSLIEMQVVIAIVMMFSSMLVVGSSELYRQAQQVACAANLSQLGTACLMVRNTTRRLPTARSNIVGDETAVRWYDLLRAYLDDTKVFTCPADWDDFARPGRDDRTRLPIFYVCYGAGRKGRCFTQWGHYDSGRDWLRGVANPDYPATATGPAFPYPVESNPDSYGGGGTEVTPDLLAGYSQVWILPTIRMDLPGPNTSHLPTSDERAALADFVASGGGVHLFAVNTPDGLRFLEALGNPVTLSGTVSPAYTFEPGPHPVVAGVGRLAAPLPTGFRARPHERFSLAPGTEAVGTKTNGSVAIAARDHGPGRILINHAIDTAMVYRPHYDHCNDDLDFKTYSINAAHWLHGPAASHITCSYGYNNQLGHDARTVAGDTIVLMDYHDWEIDRPLDGSGQDDSFIALRHGGRLNAFLADGSVRALFRAQITPRRFAPALGR